MNWLATKQSCICYFPRRPTEWSGVTHAGTSIFWEGVYSSSIEKKNYFKIKKNCFPAWTDMYGIWHTLGLLVRRPPFKRTGLLVGQDCANNNICYVFSKVMLGGVMEQLLPYFRHLLPWLVSETSTGLSSCPAFITTNNIYLVLL